MQEEKPGEHHHKKEDDTFTITKTDLWKSISVILFVLLIISIFTGGFGRGNQETTETIQKTAVKQAETKQEIAQLSVDGFSAKGAKDAKVTIVEYSSFSCGYCNRVRGTIDQILEAYPNDVEIVYKHFNRGGSDSQTAQATECASEQGKFWEMHDEIFDSGASGDLSSYAKKLGLDVTKFDDCLSSGKYKEKTEQSTNEARALGVGGTPTFFINGKKLVGAQPFEAFKTAIEAELN